MESSAPPGSSFSLTIEVDSSHREAEVILLSKLTGVEMIPEGRCSYSLPSLLLEEHKNEPVDANVGLWALIAYYLPSCNSKGIYGYLFKNGEHGIDQFESQRKDLPKEASVVPGISVTILCKCKRHDKMTPNKSAQEITHFYKCKLCCYLA